MVVSLSAMLQDFFRVAKDENLTKTQKKLVAADTPKGTTRQAQTLAMPRRPHQKPTGKSSNSAETKYTDLLLLHDLSRRTHTHKPLVNSIFLIPFRQVKGYPSCHDAAAGGQEVREALKAAGLCCSTRAGRETPFQRGPLQGEHIDPTHRTPLQLGQPPSRSRLLTKGNAGQKHRGYGRLESFLGRS